MSPQKEISSSDEEELESDDDNTKGAKFKKARFIWQIKGNYHLQNSDKNRESRETQSDAVPSTSQETMNSTSDPLDCEPSVETAQPATPSTHPSQIPRAQAVIDAPLNNPPRLTRAQADIAVRIRNESAAMLPLSGDVSGISWSACNAFNRNMKRAASPVNGEQPDALPLDPVDPEDPEWNIRKWQTIQIAKAFMDNTINSVLDAMGFVPEPESASDSGPDNLLHPMNFPHVENNSHKDEEDESVENEGILSAIQSHGLQRPPNPSQPEATTSYSYSIQSSRPSSSAPSTWEPTPEMLYRLTYPAGQPQVSKESSSVVTAEQILSPNNKEVNQTVSPGPSKSDADSTKEETVPSSVCKCAQQTSTGEGALCTCSNHSLLVASKDVHVGYESSDEEDLSNFRISKKTTYSHQEAPVELLDQQNESCKKRHGKSSFSTSILKRKCPEPADKTCKSGLLDQSTTSAVSDTGLVSVSCGSSSPTLGHFEFMDAAVAAAIQKKGLSALACQDL